MTAVLSDVLEPGHHFRSHKPSDRDRALLRRAWGCKTLVKPSHFCESNLKDRISNSPAFSNDMICQTDSDHIKHLRSNFFTGKYMVQIKLSLDMVNGILLLIDVETQSLGPSILYTEILAGRMTAWPGSCIDYPWHVPSCQDNEL